MSEYASETSEVRAKNVVKCGHVAHRVGGHDKIRNINSQRTAALMTASNSWCQCWMAVGFLLEDASLTELWPPFLSPWSPSDGPNAIVVKVKHLSPKCSTESVLALCDINGQ